MRRKEYQLLTVYATAAVFISASHRIDVWHSRRRRGRWNSKCGRCFRCSMLFVSTTVIPSNAPFELSYYAVNRPRFEVIDL